MKSTITHILTTLGAALLLAACATEPAQPDLGPVSYAPVVTSPSARTGEGGCTNLYPKEVPFAVWVRALDEQMLWAEYADESTSFIDNEQVEWNGSEWNTSAEHLWPADKALSLMAYSPASVEARFSVRGGIEFDNVDILAEGAEQLMFANPVSDQLYTFNNGVINIPFTPALAQLSFAVIPHVPDDVEVVVKKISVSNIQHCGSFCSLPEASWAPTGDTYEVVFFEGEESVMGSGYKQLGTTEWVLPQSVMARVKVVCDFHAHGTVIPNQVFEADEKMMWRVGKNYAYTIKIYMDSIGFMHDVIFEEFD